MATKIDLPVLNLKLIRDINEVHYDLESGIHFSFDADPDTLYCLAWMLCNPVCNADMLEDKFWNPVNMKTFLGQFVQYLYKISNGTNTLTDKICISQREIEHVLKSQKLFRTHELYLLCTSEEQRTILAKIEEDLNELYNVDVNS